MGIDLSESHDPYDSLNTFRKVFERKIRYWETRPMPSEERIIVSPSDSRVVLGSFRESSALFVKEKFFRYEKLLGKISRPGCMPFGTGISPSSGSHRKNTITTTRRSPGGWRTRTRFRESIIPATREQ
jgi:phosphatidylserine decarboxylase